MEALTVVAADAPAQAAWLEKHGVVVDEIPLNFDDAFRMAERLIEEGVLNPDTLPQLRLIDSFFAEMTRDGSSDRWTTAALRSDEGWSQARGVARQILAREGLDWSVPPDICVVR
ncbi:hypothetical protein [Streptomyces millisiae]|uniref:Uncharacterized protein n=1 Tax=Streptomyces millisiae TaxID=3075542 RepID=A0ABU2LV75_9ACTN|nr:hypothetical protein [Streptomyces sp. DSM 44918]MDT0321440.1 hypothetical protein [Streptomyces sp. DSM 44918]